MSDFCSVFAHGIDEWSIRTWNVARAVKVKNERDAFVLTRMTNSVTAELAIGVEISFASELKLSRSVVRASIDLIGAGSARLLLPSEDRLVQNQYRMTDILE